MGCGYLHVKRGWKGLRASKEIHHKAADTSLTYTDNADIAMACRTIRCPAQQRETCVSVGWALSNAMAVCSLREEAAVTRPYRGLLYSSGHCKPFALHCLRKAELTEQRQWTPWRRTSIASRGFRRMACMELRSRRLAEGMDLDLEDGSLTVRLILPRV